MQKYDLKIFFGDVKNSVCKKACRQFNFLFPLMVMHTTRQHALEAFSILFCFHKCAPSIFKKI